MKRPRRAFSATLILGLLLLALAACQGRDAPQLAPGATARKRNLSKPPRPD